VEQGYSDIFANAVPYIEPTKYNTMIIRKLLILLIFCVPVYGFPQDSVKPDTTGQKKLFVEDDPVVAMLDSLSSLKVFRDNTYSGMITNGNGYSNGSAPYFPDSVYRERITSMSMESPFEYVYNAEVRQFIDIYAYRKRGLTSRLLGLAQVYFPLFEEQLDRFNMPLELKYLAVIESALNPVASSRAGAKGLWQFIYSTGKVYGLKITSYVDDRFDPYKSTVAACEHLTDLYNIYGSWSLALAAYNSGAGNVNKAIRRAGGAKNFWLIQYYLPRETRSYVPAFIAASYVMNFAREHNIYPTDPGVLFHEIDTVTVHRPLTFDQISEMLNIPMEEVTFLNPSYKQGVIPATPDNPYKLRLRKKYIGDFINNETALYAYKTRKGMEQDSLMALIMSNNRETKIYVVRKGDTQASIAKKFQMTVSDLKSLNNLRSKYVKSGQRLLVYSEPPKSWSGATSVQATSAPRESVAADPVPAGGPSKIHTVKSGETLGKIAGIYGCTVSGLMEWNNLKNTVILVGQKLKVSAPGTGETAESRSQTGTSVQKSSSGGQKYIWYTIQPGDNLWDIANKYEGVTVSQLKSLNNITNANKIKPGQKIKIMPAN
jgi:membrane-bound lytic murein transglycosylase D